MADLVFNIAKGGWAEKIRDSAPKLLVILVTALEADATLRDRADVATMLANGTVEATATAYIRKTAITGTLTVDNVNDRVDGDFTDQTWTPLGGASNQAILAAIIAYEDTAADAVGRVPLSKHDFVITTDGSNVTLEVAAAGFLRST